MVWYWSLTQKQLILWTNMYMIGYPVHTIKYSPELDIPKLHPLEGSDTDSRVHWPADRESKTPQKCWAHHSSFERVPFCLWFALIQLDTADQLKKQEVGPVGGASPRTRPLSQSWHRLAQCFPGICRVHLWAWWLAHSCPQTGSGLPGIDHIRSPTTPISVHINVHVVHTCKWRTLILLCSWSAFDSTRAKLSY